MKENDELNKDVNNKTLVEAIDAAELPECAKRMLRVIIENCGGEELRKLGPGNLFGSRLLITPEGGVAAYPYGRNFGFITHKYRKKYPQFLKLLGEEKTADQISEKLQVPLGTVYFWLRRLDPASKERTGYRVKK
jgi:hypothetical protein